MEFTLSYAGFLVVAAAFLLATVWVFLLRYVPGDARIGPGPASPTRGDLLDAFAPRAAQTLTVTLVLGLGGGWVLAGRMLAPLTRITEATRLAAKGSLDHRIELEGPQDEFRELGRRVRRHARAARGARRRAAEVRRQRLARAAHAARDHEDPPRRGAQGPGPRHRRAPDRLQAVNDRAIGLTEALLLLSRADSGSFTTERVDLSLLAEEATETLLHFAEEQGVTLETAGVVAPTDGSPALLLQLVTNLVHNAIVHNLPEHGQVWVTTGRASGAVVLTVENTGMPVRPRGGAHASRAVPSRHRARPHRPAGGRARPGHRPDDHQAHHGTLTLAPRPGVVFGCAWSYRPRTPSTDDA